MTAYQWGKCCRKFLTYLGQLTLIIAFMFVVYLFIVIVSCMQ